MTPDYFKQIMQRLNDIESKLTPNKWIKRIMLFLSVLYFLFSLLIISAGDFEHEEIAQMISNTQKLVSAIESI